MYDVSLEAPVDPNEQDLGSYPPLPYEWTRRHSAALLLFASAYRPEGDTDTAEIANKIKSFERNQPLEDRQAAEIVDTAGRYFKEHIYTETKHLFALSTHAGLAMEAGERFVYRRLLPGIEDLLFSDTSAPELKELVADTVHRLFIRLPSQIGRPSRYARSKLSGNGLPFDRLARNSRQAKRRDVAVPVLNYANTDFYGHSLEGLIEVRLEDLRAAHKLRNFEADECLLDLFEEQFVLTSRVFYDLGQSRVIALEDVVGYERKGFFSKKAVFTLKSGEKLVVKGLGEAPWPNVVAEHIAG